MKTSLDLARSISSGTTWKVTVSTVSFCVLGVCYSMKNGKTGYVKHSKARRFEQDFALQVPPEAKQRLGSKDRLLRAVITVWYPSWRQDGDFALIYDLLQKTGVVSNDRWIREKHEYAEVDPLNPRCEIMIEEL